MYSRVLEASSVVMIIAALALPVGHAFAEKTFTADREEIEGLCDEHQGRFEVSWAYDDKGVQFGRKWTCEAEDIKVVCQDGQCTSMDPVDQAASS